MFNSIKRLLKVCGHNPNDYHFTTYGSYLAATDLDEKEIDMMKKTVEWCSEKKVEPIKGYITEIKKGSYFIPIDRMPIMKIDCKSLKRVNVIDKNSPYALKPTYRGKEGQDAIEIGIE